MKVVVRIALTACLFFSVPPALAQDATQDVTVDALTPMDATVDSLIPTPQTTTPETTYWRFQFFVRLNPSAFSRNVTSYIPLSSPSQEIISLKRFAPEYNYRENLSGQNLKGTWTSTTENGKTDWIIYDVATKITAQHKPKKLALSQTSPNDAQDLPLTPETAKLLDEKITELGIKDQSPYKKIRALYNYVRDAIELADTSQHGDILKIFTANKANVPDKNMLFRALISRLGVPTRIVNGVLLKDRQIKNKFHHWTELYLNDMWMEFDVNTGAFANLPPDHFILSYGNDTALHVTHGVDYSYRFAITRLTAENAYDTDDLTLPQDDLFEKDTLDKSDSQESDVNNAIGRIAMITEDPVSNSIQEKIKAEAKDSSTRVRFYNAPYESHFFRGSYFAKILAKNFENLQKTDAIFIQSGDDASLYALFRMAHNHKKLKRTVLILNGDFSKPVGNILGYALYKLLKPKDLFIIKDKMSVERAWDILQDNVLNGLPIAEVEKRWDISVQDLSAERMDELSRWRQFLVETWILASKADVNLESIYLVLVLPIIALVIVIFRNIIGFETFGTFTPILISLTFLTTGIFWGVMLFSIIVCTGTLFRFAFRKIHIHLVARMAMLIAVVGLTMLGIIIIGVHWNWGALVNISILPMVIMAGIVENFTRTQMEMGTREALRLTLSTLLAAIISYYVVDVAGVQSLVLVFPELTVIAIVIEIILGRWNGIRLTEYIRFYKIVGPSTTTQKKTD